MDEHIIIVGISSHIFSFQQGVGIIVPYCICNTKRYSIAQTILAVFWAEKIFKLHFFRFATSKMFLLKTTTDCTVLSIQHTLCNNKQASNLNRDFEFFVVRNEQNLIYCLQIVPVFKIHQILLIRYLLADNSQGYKFYIHIAYIPFSLIK